MKIMYFFRNTGINTGWDAILAAEYPAAHSHLHPHKEP
jgi:hypothetical protein